MGGSIARGIKKHTPDTEIIAIDKDESAIKAAINAGVIKSGNTCVDEALSDCDIIFLCAPVDNNTALLADVKRFIKSDAILTDIGSVKGPIHECINNAGLSDYFVGGHPMAGSEKSGFINSNDHLLENAFYILTCDNKENKRLCVMTELIKQLQAIPLFLTPKDHDYYTAAISHLPHLIASSLVNLVKDNDSQGGYMRLIAAGGFKDITRIASSDPVMWQQICNENSENIHILLSKYIDALKDIDNYLIKNDDKFAYDMFSKSKEYRDSFSDVSSGLIKKVSCLYCDLKDESGAIAKIATILAASNISLKNIGIIHNREFEDGALRIEFADDGDLILASEVLTNNKYIIYKRS